MTERPILFQPRLVRRILEGKKTQTRRIIRHPHIDESCIDSAVAWKDHGDGRWDLGASPPWTEAPRALTIRCPCGVPGDRLWVKETIKLDALGPPVGKAWASYADGTPCDRIDTWPWKRATLSAIHCPRGASRLTLETTEVRVQRVQDITDADVLAEGCDVPTAAALTGTPWSDIPSLWHAWRAVWCHVNGDTSWDANPWVWAITFKVLESP